MKAFGLLEEQLFFHSQPKSNLPQIKDFVDQDGEALLEECILIVYIDLAIASL
jgi:hypothetical protein